MKNFLVHLVQNSPANHHSGDARKQKGRASSSSFLYDSENKRTFDDFVDQNGDLNLKLESAILPKG